MTKIIASQSSGNTHRKEHKQTDNNTRVGHNSQNVGAGTIQKPGDAQPKPIQVQSAQPKESQPLTNEKSKKDIIMGKPGASYTDPKTGNTYTDPKASGTWTNPDTGQVHWKYPSINTGKGCPSQITSYYPIGAQQTWGFTA